jgi:hypothetical protein
MVHFKETGRIHFHLLLDCGGDIRTGFGFEQHDAYLQANQKATGVGPRLTLRERLQLREGIPANDLLRRCWAACEGGIPSFGFGRVWKLTVAGRLLL